MQPHIPGRPRSTRWGPRTMNRGSDGCSTESACGVGLANRQDAQNICECEKYVNYMWGEDEVVNLKVKDSNNKGKILSQDLR